MKKKILLTNKYQAKTMNIVRQFTPDGFELRTLDKPNSEALIKAVGDVDYILAGGRLKISQQVLEKAPKLKMIQRSGVGLDSLDLDAIRKKRIPVYINQGINADSVAEHTLLLMLACLRNLPKINTNTHNGIWSKQEQGVETFELSNKITGLVGMGNIGQRVAKLVNTFGSKVIYYSEPRLTLEDESNLGIEYVSLEKLLQQADIVSLHCPLTEQTRNMIGTAELAKMKKGSIIINTARGGLIDEDALYNQLVSGQIRNAALDVYSQEPITKENKLCKLDNIILTPHIGGVTYESFSSMMYEAMRNIQFFENGKLDEISDRLLTL